MGADTLVIAPRLPLALSLPFATLKKGAAGVEGEMVAKCFRVDRQPSFLNLSIIERSLSARCALSATLKTPLTLLCAGHRVIGPLRLPG